MSYITSKRKIRNLVNRFEIEDDLLFLAEASYMMREIFRSEEFPIYKYYKQKENE